MMFLLVLVYLSAAACISEEINLDPCWHRDILSVIGQAKSQNVTVLSQCNKYALIQWPLLNPQQVLMVFLLLLVDQSAVAYIFDEINLSSCWRKDTLRVKGRASITNCNFNEFVRPICHHRVVLVDTSFCTHCVFSSFSLSKCCCLLF